MKRLLDKMFRKRAQKLVLHIFLVLVICECMQETLLKINILKGLSKNLQKVC